MRYEIQITATLEQPGEGNYTEHYDYGYSRATIEVDEFVSHNDVAKAISSGLYLSIARAYNMATEKRAQRRAKEDAAYKEQQSVATEESTE